MSEEELHPVSEIKLERCPRCLNDIDLSLPQCPFCRVLLFGEGKTCPTCGKELTK